MNTFALLTCPVCHGPVVCDATAPHGLSPHPQAGRPSACEHCNPPHPVVAQVTAPPRRDTVLLRHVAGELSPADVADLERAHAAQFVSACRLPGQTWCVEIAPRKETL